MKTLKESLLDDIETTLSKDTAIEEILKTLFSDGILIGQAKYIELLKIITEKCEFIDASELEEYCKQQHFSIYNSWAKQAFIKEAKPHLKKNDWAIIIDKNYQLDCFDCSNTLELWIGKLDNSSRCYHICVYTVNGTNRGYMHKSNNTFFEEYKSKHNVYVFPKSLKKIVTDCVKTYKERTYDYYKNK